VLCPSAAMSAEAELAPAAPAVPAPVLPWQEPPPLGAHATAAPAVIVVVSMPPTGLPTEGFSAGFSTLRAAGLQPPDSALPPLAVALPAVQQPLPPMQMPPAMLEPLPGGRATPARPSVGPAHAVARAVPAVVGDPVKVAQGAPQAPLKWKNVDFTDPDARDAIAFSGITLMVIRSIALVWGLVLSGEESLHFLGVIVYGASGLVCLWGLVSLVRPSSVPRGCECAPACATAQSGILSCPCVPWTLGLWGLLAILATIIIWWMRGLNVLVIDTASGALLAAFGFVWLGRLRCQDGHWCCARSPKTAAVDLTVQPPMLALPVSAGGLPIGSTAPPPRPLASSMKLAASCPPSPPEATAMATLPLVP